MALVCGRPLIGLVVPLMLWAGGEFGVSENLRHICAAVLPTQNDFFRYDWKSKGQSVVGVSTSVSWAALATRSGDHAIGTPSPRCQSGSISS